MTRCSWIVAVALAALTPASAVRADPRCSLASGAEPCERAPAPPRSDRSSPWLDEGATPAWLAPAADATPRDHRTGSMLALGGIYASFATWMYFAWYHDQPRLSGFKVGGDGYFGEDTYAGGSDKLGHAWANMVLTRGGAELLRWGGWRPRTAALVSAGLAWSLFFYVEIKDGYYYQLSPGDLYANTLGAALGVAMTEWPALDRLLDFRVEYWPSPEYRSILDGTFTGSDRINSVNIAEDYSGQTYFLALHLRELLPARRPRWTAPLDFVDVGVGFQATKYKPDPPEQPPYVRRQELFVGVALDVQHLLDRALAGRGGAARTTRAIGHGLFEVLSPPFTILPVVGAERSPDE